MLDLAKTFGMVQQFDLFGRLLWLNLSSSLKKDAMRTNSLAFAVFAALSISMHSLALVEPNNLVELGDSNDLRDRANSDETVIQYRIELRGPMVPYRPGKEVAQMFEAGAAWKKQFPEGWEGQHETKVRERLEGAVSQLRGVTVAKVAVSPPTVDKVEIARFPHGGIGPTPSKSYPTTRQLDEDPRSGPIYGYYAVAHAEVKARLVLDETQNLKLVRVAFDMPIEGNSRDYYFDTDRAVKANNEALSSYTAAVVPWWDVVKERVKHVPGYFFVYAQDPWHLPCADEDNHWVAEFQRWGYYHKRLFGSEVYGNPHYSTQWRGWKVEFQDEEPSVWLIAKRSPAAAKKKDPGALADNELRIDMVVQGDIYGFANLTAAEYAKEATYKNIALDNFNAKHQNKWEDDVRNDLTREIANQLPVSDVVIERDYESVPTLRFDAEGIERGEFPPLVHPIAYQVDLPLSVTVTLTTTGKVTRYTDIPLIQPDTAVSSDAATLLNELRALRKDFTERCKAWRLAERKRWTNHDAYEFVYAQGCEQAPHLKFMLKTWPWKPPYVDRGGVLMPWTAAAHEIANERAAQWTRPADGLIRQWYAHYENRDAHVWLLEKTKTQ